MTDPSRLIPFQASERLHRDPKWGFTLCRGSSEWAGTGIASLNESVLNENGRYRGKEGRRRDLGKAWSAAGRGRPSYNQGHVLKMHHAMFPGMPDPILVATRDFDNLWGLLGKEFGDFAISIALDLSALPASDALRQNTGPVGHQVVLYRKRVKNGKGQARVLDPMAPYSDTDVGYWAKRSSISKAAKAIEGGLVICELYPVGAWTSFRNIRRAKNAEIKELEFKVASNNAKVTALRERLTVAEVAAEGYVEDTLVWGQEREELQIEIERGRGPILDEVIASINELR
jgi:hypothetical protein